MERHWRFSIVILGIYLLKKTANTLLTLFGVLTVVFFLFNVLPGDPARMMLGQNEDQEQLAIVKKNMGLINHFQLNTDTI